MAFPWAALITAGAGLIGARSDAKARARSDYMNSPQGIRDNAEKAGFNPLVFAGPGTGTGAQYAPTMGSIIAQTGATMADQFLDYKALEIQQGQLEMENERLASLVRDTTLRPDVPGIYGARRNAEIGGYRPADSDGLAIDTDLGLDGVDTDAAVRGTVPYIGMTGQVIPGPNPETQMGIDEVLGWAALEALALVKGSVVYSWERLGEAFTNLEGGPGVNWPGPAKPRPKPPSRAAVGNAAPWFGAAFGDGWMNEKFN